MKKLCMLMLLVCLILTAACGKPKATDNTIRLQGRTEAVLYTVKAPVDGEIRGLILDAGERIRKGQPLFGLGTQDENPEVEKAATELAKAQARLNNASQGNSDASRASAGPVSPPPRPVMTRSAAPIRRKNWPHWNSRCKSSGLPMTPLSLPWRAARSSVLPPALSGRYGSKTGKL